MEITESARMRVLLRNQAVLSHDEFRILFVLAMTPDAPINTVGVEDLIGNHGFSRPELIDIGERVNRKSAALGLGRIRTHRVDDRAVLTWDLK